jgi:hypothetical protein
MAFGPSWCENLNWNILRDSDFDVQHGLDSV